MTTIRWTPEARADLRGIRDWIAQDSPMFAKVFVNRLLRSVERLRRFPRSGRIVPEYGLDHIREVIMGSYRVVYRLNDSAIDVLTVFHSTWSISLRDVDPE